ncbi:alpha/beta hydrolase [Hyphomicrobium sp.]|uniref:alpha/beta hydrolase n=1 Tax=Hyphomicrobium sp. TaxID=82 RepID=UPI002D77E295|nr:alpha/beta hydrolase [Hyphomicrobium sp.]HET6390325.1 alpha/beta hydrolase [Hyphomicrobium sp.]
MKLVSLSINPVPSGAKVMAFDGYDGLKLRCALWEATRGPSRGTVVIVQGRSEFIEKYFEVIADLRRRGFAVAAFDLRGQGGSERTLANRRKGHVVAFTEYDRDLAIFIDEIVRPALPEPLIGLGHSLGGNILLRAAQDEASPFARMILLSPMVEIHDGMLGASRGLVTLYSNIASLCGFATAYVRGGGNEPTDLTEFEGNRLTSDFVRWSRIKSILEAAPDLAVGAPTVGWLRAALRSCAMLSRPDYPKYVSVPMMLFAAGADRVVTPQAIEDFAVDLKCGGHILIPGSRHEILQETDAIRQRFWAAFDAYMGIDTPSPERV